MHAIVVEETGGPEQLKWVERPEPVPGPGQVAVRVKLTSVNFADIQARRGTGVTKTPFTPGLDGMGTVVAIGSGVTRVLVAAGKVKILEGGRFALRDCGQAHDLVQSRASTGRVFLVP